MLCVWPFGYEDLIFFPRTVGKIWSCYWDDHKPLVQRIKESTGVATDNSLCNLSCKDNESGQIDSFSLTTDAEKSFSNEWLGTQKSTIQSPINDTDIIPAKHETALESTNSKTENIGTVQQVIDNLDFSNAKSKVPDNIKKANLKLENQKTVVQVINAKAVPKITKIEKTNIDFINIKVDEPVETKLPKNSSANSEQNAKSRKTAESNIGLSSHISDSQSQKIFEESVKETQNNSSNTKKSNLNVTTVKIDGLPPITLSYEIPETITSPTTVIASTPKKIASTTKRNVTSGRQYEKFSFSAIKKKKENENDESKNANISLTGKDVTKELNTLNTATTVTIPTIATATAAETVQNQDKLTLDTSLANSSDCIDSVLENILSNNYSVSEEINDEWLNSLLS